MSLSFWYGHFQVGIIKKFDEVAAGVLSTLLSDAVSTESG